MALHRTNTAVLRRSSKHSENTLGQYRTYCKEDPLEHLAIIVRAILEAELIVLVVSLLEVQQDRRRLKHREIVVGSIDNHRDTAVRVQLDEPGFLLGVLHDVDGLGPMVVSMRRCEKHPLKQDSLVLEPIRSFQLLQEDGDLESIGRARRVKLDRCLRHDTSRELTEASECSVGGNDEGERCLSLKI